MFTMAKKTEETKNKKQVIQTDLGIQAFYH